MQHNASAITIAIVEFTNIYNEFHESILILFVKNHIDTVIRRNYAAALYIS